MADPVFIASLDILKAQLRLSGIDVTSNAQAILEATVGRVRTEFYARLGVSRMVTLIALPSVSAPTTSEQVLRMIAEQCEALWVRCLLLDVLPVTFMDASGGDLEFINQEGTFRSIPDSRLAGIRERCQIQIEEWLALLSGEVDIGNAPGVQIHTQEDQAPRMFPNGSLLGRNARLWGDPTREIQ